MNSLIPQKISSARGAEQQIFLEKNISHKVRLDRQNGTLTLAHSMNFEMGNFGIDQLTTPRSRSRLYLSIERFQIPEG
jgi:hypothetical protein